MLGRDHVCLPKLSSTSGDLSEFTSSDAPFHSLQTEKGTTLGAGPSCTHLTLISSPAPGGWGLGAEYSFVKQISRSAKLNQHIR